MLNADYKSTGFQFALASTTRIYNVSWATANFNSEEAQEMIRTLRKGQYDALNIYINFLAPIYGLLGYATFPLPRKVDRASDRLYDGVVLDYLTLPSRPSEPVPWDYALGKTAVHEVGHWLTLLHTFQGGCAGNLNFGMWSGDLVMDTPAEASPTFKCDKPVDTCPNEPGIDSLNNYMSYADDVCLNTFTAGQVERLVAGFDGLRRGVKVPRPAPRSG